MKTWIVTFEIIAFIVIYFPLREQDNPPSKVSTSWKVAALEADNDDFLSHAAQESWVTSVSILEDHIRPPPPRAWGTFYLVYNCAYWKPTGLKRMLWAFFIYRFPVHSSRFMVHG